MKNRMKIPLINTVLNIRINGISREPNIKKLEKELSCFFSENKVGRRKIKAFRIEKYNGFYSIFPLKPFFEKRISRDDEICKKVREIGNKYRIDYLKFVGGCYINDW